MKYGTRMELGYGVLPRVWTEAAREGPSKAPCILGSARSPEEVQEVEEGGLRSTEGLTAWV